MKKLQLLLTLGITLLSFDILAQDACDAKAKLHYDQEICQGKRLQSLDNNLNKVYKIALATMPEKDDSDNRKEREQLRKSQRAWLAYSREQCALEGGLEGGSNSWVSTFAGDCMEKELNSRINFLQSIVDGKFKG